MLGMIAAVVLIWNYRRINRQRALALERGEHEKFTVEELSVQGDRAVTFRYTL